MSNKKDMENMSIKETFVTTKKVIFAASTGNLLEMYSFSLFVMLLPTLTPIFFPFSDPLAALLSAYLVFSVGFLAYPLGALFFGYLGDRYGRKISLSFSLFGMALSTFFIGLLPSYAVFGIAAPLILASLRLIQSACAGGECMGSGLFLMESAADKNHGFFGSLTAASGTFGALFASLISAFFISSIMPHWAWRIPFVFSIFIGAVGLYFRRTLDESPSFKNSSFTGSNPIKELLSHHLRSFFCAIGIGALGTVPFYFIIGFLNNYFVFLNTLTAQESSNLNFILLLFCVFTMPLAGYLADKIGPAKIMRLSAFFSLIFAYPFFCMVMFADSFLKIVLAEVFFLALSQLFVAPISAFMVQLFPVRARYTGTAFGYCIGMALFGGTTPSIAFSLINWSGSVIFPSLYVMLVCLIGFVSVKFSKKLN